MGIGQKFQKVKYKLEDHMLLGSLYDQFMLKTKYREGKLSFLYNVMVGQKHRMLFYQKLKKKYMKSCTQNCYWEKEEKQYNAKRVWFCWLQGLDKAPDLVKRCYESLRKHMPDKEFVLIDESNIEEYITLPEHIKKKWQNGIIKPAHFSDLIRLELLIKYGGYWIDSTVFCTDASLFQQIDKVPLFMYSFYYFGFNPEIMETNNWLIHSTTNQNILCLVRELLYAYWKDYNRDVNYFIFHIFMTMASEYYAKEYEQMPIVSQAEPHILATYIGQPFDELKYEILKARTGIHKLSNGFSKEDTEKENTFYDYLIKGKLQ